MSIFRKLFGENKTPGTALGRFIVTLLPGHTLRMGATLADITLADILENVYKGDQKLDKDDVKSALSENREEIKALFLALMREAFANIDVPFLDDEREEMTESYIIDQVDIHFNTIFDKLLTL